MAITIKELKKHFEISKFKGEFLLYDKSAGSGKRFVYKFLCSIKHKRGVWEVPGFKPTGVLEKLKENVTSYVNSLEYDSEYYDPRFRDGYFEYMIIFDYLDNLGFKHTYLNSDLFEYNVKNIYGTHPEIVLSFTGLEYFVDKLSEEVKINYHINSGSWISVTTKRNVKDIKEGIDKILSPLLLSDTVNNIKTNEKLKKQFTSDVDVIINNIKDLDIQQSSMKEYLKEELKNLIDSL